MDGRTPAEAVSNYVELVQRAVSCVSDSVVNVDGGYYPAETPHIMSMNRGVPVRLAGSSRLWFLLRQYYQIIESGTDGHLWKVSETGYRYAVLDADGRELLEYHWHPGSESPIATPHLHIGHGAMVSRPEIGDAHLPTGKVSISEILRTLIRDFSVTPRRSDWESVLDESPDS